MTRLTLAELTPGVGALAPGLGLPAAVVVGLVSRSV
jgi:hypothetical protein